MKILVSANGFGGATSKSGVLAIPLVAATGTSASRDTAHLAEVDRRSGGGLTALRNVDDASTKRFAFATAAAGSLPAEQLLFADRKSTRLNSSHMSESRMPSSA